ncbi:hypothetical protein Tco_0535238 [Tanacetum coccineum]
MGLGTWRKSPKRFRKVSTWEYLPIGSTQGLPEWGKILSSVGTGVFQPPFDNHRVVNFMGLSPYSDFARCFSPILPLVYLNLLSPSKTALTSTAGGGEEMKLAHLLEQRPKHRKENQRDSGDQVQNQQQRSFFPCAFHHFFVMENGIDALGTGEQRGSDFVISRIGTSYVLCHSVFAHELTAFRSWMCYQEKSSDTGSRSCVLAVPQILEKMLFPRLKFVLDYVHEDSELEETTRGEFDLRTNGGQITRISLILKIGRSGWGPTYLAHVVMGAEAGEDLDALAYTILRQENVPCSAAHAAKCPGF